MRSGTSEGHPGLYVFSWTVDSDTGRFAGATAGNGADITSLPG